MAPSKSRLMCSLQVNAPGTLATSVPVWFRPCQTPKTAPVTSVAITSRPCSMTSIGALRTCPPALAILAAVASTSADAK